MKLSLQPKCTQHCPYPSRGWETGLDPSHQHAYQKGCACDGREEEISWRQFCHWITTTFQSNTLGHPSTHSHCREKQEIQTQARSGKYLLLSPRWSLTMLPIQLQSSFIWNKVMSHCMCNFQMKSRCIKIEKTQLATKCSNEKPASKTELQESPSHLLPLLELLWLTQLRANIFLPKK